MESHKETDVTDVERVIRLADDLASAISDFKKAPFDEKLDLDIGLLTSFSMDLRRLRGELALCRIREEERRNR